MWLLPQWLLWLAAGVRGSVKQNCRRAGARCPAQWTTLGPLWSATVLTPSARLLSTTQAWALALLMTRVWALLLMMVLMSLLGLARLLSMTVLA